MPTTTIRLTEELKRRIARAAKRAGKTSHAFVIDALAEKADEDEQRNDFHETAERRYAQIVASGRTIPWSEMRAHLEGRLANRKLQRPAAKKLAR